MTKFLAVLLLWIVIATFDSGVQAQHEIQEVAARGMHALVCCAVPLRQQARTMCIHRHAIAPPYTHAKLLPMRVSHNHKLYQPTSPNQALT
jgi:hypothetical protein